MKLDVCVVALCMAASLGSVCAKDPSPTAPAGVNSRNEYSDSLRGALIASDRPRDWALAATMLLFDDDARLQLKPSARELFVRATQAAPNDALVQWIAASNQFGGNGALVLRDLPDENVRALVRLEPDNAAVWMMSLQLATSRGDAGGSDEALQHMASAVRFDDHFVDIVHAWFDVYARHPPPASVFQGEQGVPNTWDDAATRSVGTAVAAFAQAAAALYGPYQALPRACRPGPRNGDDAYRHTYCVEAGRLMLDRSTTMIARSIGFVVLRNLDETTAGDRLQRRDIEWVRYAGSDATIGLFERANATDAIAYFTDWRDLDNEIDVMRRVVSRSGWPPAAPGFWGGPEPLRARATAAN